MLRKIISFLLLVIILGNVIGMHFFHIYKEYEAKKNFINNNPKIYACFDLKELNHKNFVWIKKNKEFKLNNNLYDIVKIISTSHQTKILCINDSYEKKIEQLFYKLHKEKKENKKKLNTNGYYLPILITNQNIVTLKRKKKNIKTLISQLSTIYLDTPYSPPKNNLLS